MRHVDLPVTRERAVSALVLAGIGDPHGQVGHGLDGAAALDNGRGEGCLLYTSDAADE